MAKASIEIVQALRNTAARLKESDKYQWGHMGSCNCGFLAQEITHLSREEIHSRAMSKNGDWSEQLNDYCPTSGYLMDNLIHDMLSFGFDRTDLIQLERLSDPNVLGYLKPWDRNLQYNVKADAIRYLLVWADKLENEMLSTISLIELTETTKVEV